MIYAMYKTNRGHRALRRGRYSQAGQMYLITFSTHCRQPVFKNHIAAETACRCINSSAVSANETMLPCWVLMPDHMHLLVELGDENLALFVGRCKAVISNAVNDQFRRSGAIWCRAYHDHALRRDEDMQAIARYIIYNPVRAGLAAKPGDYPYWNAVWL